MQICKRNVPSLANCLKESTEALRPYLRDGIPEMHLPPIEPLLVPHAELDTGESFKATFDNFLVYGLTNYTLKNIDVDLDKNSVDLDLLFPFVRTTGDYKLKGRLLILQLNGFGKCDGNYSEHHFRFA